MQRMKRTMIQTKSIHAEPSGDDGFRVLVEPVWPPRVSRERTKLDVWLRDLAPSPALYAQFAEERVGWDEFVFRYHRELNGNREFFSLLIGHALNGGLTLVHGTRCEDRNVAVALKLLLERETGSDIWSGCRA